MENKTADIQEESVIKPDVNPQSSVLKKVLMPLLLVFIIILLGIIIFLLRQPKETSTVQPAPEITSSVSPTTTVQNTSDWKTYTNNDAGFSFQYPPSVLINAETKNADQLVLLVSADKLSSIPENLPLSMGRSDALQEQERLLKGEGENLVKVGSLHGQVETIFSRFEVCSVLFEKKLTFYPNGYRVILNLVAPENEIIKQMSDFFTVDTANCGNQQIWNHDKVEAFATLLEKKQGTGMAQNWFDTFEAIVKTLKLVDITQSTPSASYLVYKNETYGFEIHYPKEYQALSDQENLYGYKNGVVLFYSSGQAYDVIVEVWDSQTEYENAYATRISDVTVVKNKDKFITLLDNTQKPENKEIISSFNLLP